MAEGEGGVALRPIGIEVLADSLVLARGVLASGGEGNGLLVTRRLRFGGLDDRRVGFLAHVDSCCWGTLKCAMPR